MKNLVTIIEGAIAHILNITPKEEKRIKGLKRLTLASHISMEKIMLRLT